VSAPRYDVAIIGAGVVGCAVARELSRYELRAILLEARSDLCDGASKGNSALMVSGYDLEEGTLERRLVMRGHQRYLAEAPALGLPIQQIGAMMLAWTHEQVDRLNLIHARARKAAHHDVRLVDPGQVYARSPGLGTGLVAALWAPSEAIVDPFSTAYAYALDAHQNGVAYRNHSPVIAASREVDGWRLVLPESELSARTVINCAGLAGDRVDALAGFHDFTIRPIRGQYILFDKSARGLLDFIALPTPNENSRGILLTPTIFGNLLVGPTAEPVADISDSGTTAEGLAILTAAAKHVLPSIFEHQVTTSFAGVRPGTEERDYRIFNRLQENWVTVGGIRSTGLSGSLGIAEHVADMVAGETMAARLKDGLRQVSVPDLSAAAPRPWESPNCQERDREIVCHCEQITRGEISRALDSPIPPRSRKALKRRTRAMFGRCQGFYCSARIEQLFWEKGR
jgi:glycerol-3-phosphate dehydrogenase